MFDPWQWLEDPQWFPGEIQNRNDAFAKKEGEKPARACFQTRKTDTFPPHENSLS